ncbi:hypothetical protein [Streptomyces coffeae]|uniref:Uncharacterized protein n=1 Tax=Streptomyces coffeae TaxID=621382 RepID=A0ABS1N7F4_9ACTN|nr:hypothetical protein [Streptomyces coffeae]MBL1096004.1 hypothetical protein [Streptomyces coffeae]
MMPPICAVCRSRPERDSTRWGGFDVVYFRPTVEYPDDWAGHPENAEWFCPTHLPLTEGLTDLTANEALKRIMARASSRSDEQTHDVQTHGAQPHGDQPR